MLTEERFNSILKILEERNSITVQELTKLLNSSESTIRRDLNSLHKMGKLKKVHGGATSINLKYDTKDDNISHRHTLNIDSKQAIAKYAGSLIEENDFVFIDAGTTIYYMVDYITVKNVTFVTNAVEHAIKLSKKGFKVFVTGGEFKNTTEALVGNETVESIKKYNFTKGFFGANGITKKAHFTTPDVNEALTKKVAIERCLKSYILCDSSKFGKVSSVTFANLCEATIITDRIDNNDDIKKETNIVEVLNLWFTQ